MNDGVTVNSTMIATCYRRAPFEPIADLRAVVAWMYIVAATVVWGLLGIISLVFDRKAAFLSLMAEMWGRSILKVCGVRTVVEGIQYADLTEPRVVMPNHQSLTDIWIILAHMPRKFRFVAKAEMRHVPIIGSVLSRGGHVLVDRKNPKRAFASYNAAAEQIRGGTSIVIFAEGTRSADGRLLPFKKGGFMLALKAGVPIVPVTIDGSARILPKGSWRIRPGTVRVVFHKPISLAEYSADTRNKLIQTVRESIESGLTDIDETQNPVTV